MIGLAIRWGDRETTRSTNAFSFRCSLIESKGNLRATGRSEEEGGKGGEEVGAREQLSWDSWQGKRAPGTFEKSMALITKCRYLGRLQSLLYRRRDFRFVKNILLHIFSIFFDTARRSRRVPFAKFSFWVDIIIPFYPAASHQLWSKLNFVSFILPFFEYYLIIRWITTPYLTFDRIIIISI